MIDFQALGLDLRWCEVLGRAGHLACVADDPDHKPWVTLLLSPEGTFLVRSEADGEYAPAPNMPSAAVEVAAGIAILAFDWRVARQIDAPGDSFVLHPGLAALLPDLPTDPEEFAHAR